MQLIEDFFKKLKKEWIAAFLGSFVVGFLTYLYMLANHFGDPDCLSFQFDSQNMIGSGRQFLSLAGRFSSFYDIQAFNGIFALALIGISSVFIVECFGVKRKISAVLIGAVLAIFPAISSTMAFHFAIDAYMIAVLCVVLSFWLSVRYKYGFVPAIFLTGFSLGIYQAYYAFLITLCILYLLVKLIDSSDIKKLLILSCKFIAMGVGGFVFYYISLKLMLNKQGMSLSEYQGVDTLNSFNIDILQGIRAAYHGVGRFLFLKRIITYNNALVIALSVITICAVVIYVWMFLANKEKMIFRGLLAIALVIIIPMGLYVVGIMLPDIYYYNLMEYAWALLICFTVILADKISDTKNNKYAVNALSGATAIAVAVMLFQFAISANVIAYNLNEMYEKSYAMCVRIVDRLEQTEGFDRNDKVAVLGGWPSSSYYPSVNTARYVFPYYEGAWEDWSICSLGDFQSFVSHYLGLYLYTASQDEIDNIIENSGEYKNMPCFPEADSIKKIDNIWIIKFN